MVPSVPRLPGKWQLDALLAVGCVSKCLENDGYPPGLPLNRLEKATLKQVGAVCVYGCLFFCVSVSLCACVFEMGLPPRGGFPWRLYANSVWGLNILGNKPNAWRACFVGAKRGYKVYPAQISMEQPQESSHLRGRTFKSGYVTIC